MLNYLKNILAVLTFLPLAVCYAANPKGQSSLLTPYLGIETGYTHHSYKSGYGSELFKKSQPKINLFVGFKLNEFLNLELGLEKTTNKRNRDVTLNGGGKSLGNFIDPTEITTATISSHSKFIGRYAGITGNWHLTNSDFSLIGGIALKRERASLSRTLKTFTQPNGSIDNPYTTSTLTQTKTLVRLTGGVQYALSEHVSARAIANWENASRLKPKGISIQTGNPLEARLKNAVGCSIGLVFNY